MIHIVTAFSREFNLQFYLDNLDGKGIVWHPVFYESQLTPTIRGQLSLYPWVQKAVVPEHTHACDLCYYKLNAFLDQEEIIDEDFYMFMNDDDWFDVDILPTLGTLDKDVVFISMMRGDVQVSVHPVSTLYATPNVYVGNIGLEQMVVRGKILKTERFDIYNGCADGIMAMQLAQKYPVHCESSLYAYFNYLEPGRWVRRLH